jgi:glycosyltransferase involved in cell wall biosynthesis
MMADQWDRPARILYLMESRDVGGLEVIFLNLLANLDRAQFQPLVVCPPEGAFAQRVRKLEVEVLVLPLGQKPGGAQRLSFISPGIVWSLIRFVKHRKIDILHSYEFRTRNYAHITSLSTGLPLVCGCNMPNWAETMGNVQLRIVNALAKEVITISQCIREGLLSRGIINPDKIRTVYPGVDLELFSPKSDNGLRRDFQIPPESPLVGIVARFDPIKNLSGFLQAAAMVARDLPKARFCIVGGELTSFDSDGSNLRRMIQEMNLSDRVILTGPRQDMPNVFAGLDLVVSSSLSESFGMALVEAMAVGKPVVATRCGGPEEIVAHGKTGLLVRPEDSASLAQGMMTLLTDKALARGMGEAGRRRVELCFDVKRHARELENSYRVHLQNRSFPAGGPRYGSSSDRGITGCA